ncbi:MAG: hypothetical protein JXR96_11815 [Deltaproteobacteria bacterium]|nr:hypothetical protein [Deltaproteobacteria bacterium]
MRRFLPVLLVCLASFAAPARGDEHQLELLRAQVEDLQQRLSAERLEQVLSHAGCKAHVRSGQIELRELAGARLGRTPLRLTGRLDQILDCLDALGTARHLPAPPLVVTGLETAGPAERLRVEIHAWHLEKRKFDPRSSAAQLESLRDNLLWLERQMAGRKALLRLLDALLDSEAVHLQRLDCSQGKIRLTGLALQASARQAYLQSAAERIAELPYPPELDADGLRCPTPQQLQPGSGLNALDLDARAALLDAARLAKLDLILVGPGLRPLSGHWEGEGSKLLGALLADLPLKHRKRDKVEVCGLSLGKEPPRPVVFSRRPVSIELGRVPLEHIWSLLASRDRLGWISAETRQLAGGPRRCGEEDADPDRLRATLRLADLPIDQAASLLAWSLGKRIAGETAAVYLGGPDGPPAIPPAPLRTEPLRLFAASAPLPMLVSGLLQPGTALEVCGRSAHVHARTGPLSTARLLEALLDASGARLERRPAGWILRTGPGACTPAGARAEPGEPDRLAAILAGKKRGRALIFDRGRWSWLGRGYALADRRAIRRVRPTRVVLRREGGRAESLAPTARCAPELGRPGPSQFALCRLRLSATYNRPDGAALAWLTDPAGRTHLIERGDLIGRRCGRVQSISPGRMVVALECAAANEPSQVQIGLSPAARPGAQSSEQKSSP